MSTGHSLCPLLRIEVQDAVDLLGCRDGQRGDRRTSVYCTINVSDDAWVAEPEIAVTVRV